MGTYRHFPAFDHLCDLADVQSRQVRLRAGERVSFGVRRGEEREHLTSIELWVADSRVEAAAIFSDDLEAAARDLLARVV